MDAATLGNFISTQRKKLGMTQKELAKKINVTDKAISKWERGAGLPDINILEPLAEALEINLVELMTCEIKDMGAEQIDNESVRETLDYANNKTTEADFNSLPPLLLLFFHRNHCPCKRVNLRNFSGISDLHLVAFFYLIQSIWLCVCVKIKLISVAIFIGYNEHKIFYFLDRACHCFFFRLRICGIGCCLCFCILCCCLCFLCLWFCGIRISCIGSTSCCDR